MKKRLLFAIFVLGLMLSVAFAPIGAAAEKPQGITPALKAAQTHQDFQEAGATLIKAEGVFSRAINAGLNEAAAQHKMTAQMEQVLQPETLIPMFLRDWKKFRQAEDKTASLAKAGAQKSAQTTSISGKVLVNGEAPEYPVFVVAFDQYGYYRGDSKKWYTAATGDYSIQDLPAGDYYVMTVSDNYVDEIYNNLVSPLDSRQTWRLAEKVHVEVDQTASGVDFDLQAGAELSGAVSRDDGSPIQGMTLSFVFTPKSASLPIFTVQKTTDDGWYSIKVPLVGEYKVSVEVEGEIYKQTWYPNQPSWEQGEVVTIPAYDAQVGDLNFTLAPYPAGTRPGSITGIYRWSDTAQLISIATVFLFDAKDSSLVDFQLGFLGSYLFPAVPPGEYILYLDDQLGNLIGGVNYLGQYYSGANTPGAATTITVGEGEEVTLKDIVLEPGGVLSGTIKSEEGKPLNGVWVLAIDATLKELELEPWLSNLHLFIGMADAKGAYTIAGLPTGKYLVRTISDSLINASALGLITIKSGAHAGEVVDAWYGGSANLFSMASATPVEVVAPNETAHIDFVLEKAKWIYGKITDSIDGTGKGFYRLIAMNDTSAYPYLSLTMLINNHQIDGGSGSYRLGPLPSGKYKILAMAPVTGFNNYLSEMYGGARDFVNAAVIAVGNSDVTGADISVERGATIQGFIDLPQEVGGAIRAGADVLDGFPVIVYDAATGKLASLDYVQFNGGYKIDHLLAGTYRILALPVLAPYAATYYGGGDSFDDAGAGGTVTVGFGETVACDILLEKGTGAITGFVDDADTKAPLSQIMVIAYDKTGHPVGLSMSDMNLATGFFQSQTGQFTIPGLRQGQYYLRTYALSSALGLADQLLSLYNAVVPGNGEELDYMDLLFGNGLSDLGSLFDLNMNIYGDQWHYRVPAKLELDLNAFALNLLAYGLPSGHDSALLPIYLPLPLAEAVPALATPVTVAYGATVSGIEFSLSESLLSDVVAGVEEQPAALPESFVVYANYPNPFNPATTLGFDLPATGQVRVEIFDALGRQVRLLQDGVFPAGRHQLKWDGRSSSGDVLPSGLYLARFQSGAAQKMIKMVLMK